MILDDGYQFGLGVFETICLRDGKPELLSWHLERINHSLKVLGISQEVLEDEVLSFLKKEISVTSIPSLHAMKIMVSQENKIFAFRSNPYTQEKISNGFLADYSAVYRNETSPLTFHKTMNYGDNILEKRRTKAFGIDEYIFKNSRGEICEGSTTNIFFVRENKIFTPEISCGLLPGIMRRFIMQNFDVCETIITPSDVLTMEECFLTNSLMGIMHVKRLGEKVFYTDEMACKCRNSLSLLSNENLLY